jgi:hypothetical protein
MTMTTTRLVFRRIVLELSGGNAPQRALEAVAALARWLDAGLLAVFVEDSALYEYARLPFAREIAPGAAWRPLEPGRLLDDYVAAAAAAQRRLRMAAARAGVPCEFEMLRGGPAVSYVRAGPEDLLAVFEPADPAAHRLPAHDAPCAGQLILPRSLRRERGPVVVVATSPDEAAQAVAARIAAAAGEALIALEASPDAARGLPPSARRMRCAPTARAAAAALQATRESLIVVPRRLLYAGAGHAAGASARAPGEAALTEWVRLAAERGVALLLVDGT